MEASIQERETTLKILESQLNRLSVLFKECYLKRGRGALIVHTHLLEKEHQLSSIDYNNQNDSLELFDNKKSQKELRGLINKYDPKTEGVIILITKSNATWFITCKLKSKN